MEVAEYVSNAGAGNSLDGAAALPDAEGHLQVLTTPTVHLFVVAAHFPEVATIYGKQSAGHGGTVCWTDLPLLLALASLALLLPLRQIDPVKVAIPLESADLEGFVAICAVLEVVGIDDIDNGHQHASPRLLDALQEWLAPANVTLAMGVQEDEHIPRGDSRSGQSGTNQTQSAKRQAKTFFMLCEGQNKTNLLGHSKTFDRLPSTINTNLHGIHRVKSSESLQSSRADECNARRNRVWELQKVKPNTHNRNLTNWFSLHFVFRFLVFGFLSVCRFWPKRRCSMRV